MPQTEPHDEFIQLCAVSTSGQLTEEERKKLQEHLAVCPVCRNALRQYEAIVVHSVPAIAGAGPPSRCWLASTWSQELAEAALFRRIADEEKISAPVHATPVRDSNRASQTFSFSSAATWRNMWALYATGIMLFIGLGVLTYQVGRHSSMSATKIDIPQASWKSDVSLEEKVSDTDHEAEIAGAEIEQRDRFAELRRQLHHQSAEVHHLRTLEVKLESEMHGEATGREDIAHQRIDIEHELTAAQSKADPLQQNLDSLAQESSGDAARALALEVKVNNLTRQLREREAAVETDQKLLDHDRIFET